ncbi:hypothetical protein M513_09931 [Trichuris suis]|uniref:Uncharacterized protein n=1 Tax=Trichuris suis TaxID=68888 RepID=A0A085LW63_9BILA|nr:hypothetical protein M513_09931 [Trichuris suis]
MVEHNKSWSYYIHFRFRIGYYNCYCIGQGFDCPDHRLSMHDISESTRNHTRAAFTLVHAIPLCDGLIANFSTHRDFDPNPPNRACVVTGVAFHDVTYGSLFHICCNVTVVVGRTDTRLVARICGFHPHGPGSIPGTGIRGSPTYDMFDDGSRLELTADVPANVGRVEEPLKGKTSPVVDNVTLMTGHG